MSFLDRFNLEEQEQRIELFRKYQKYLFGLIAAIIIFYGFLWIVTPKYKVYRENKVRLNRFIEVLETRRAKALDKKNILKELARLEATVYEKETNFFTEEEYNEFSINILPKLSNNLGNTIDTITFSPFKRLKDNIHTATLGLRFEGSYISVINFIMELERFSKVIKIEEFSFKRLTDDPVILSVNLQAIAYININK